MRLAVCCGKMANATLQPYEARAAQDKKRYEEEKAAYLANGGSVDYDDDE
jgi:hypothetical protein